jgi:hypothetical protein
MEKRGIVEISEHVSKRGITIRGALDLSFQIDKGGKPWIG